jgi:tight adherence protein C
MYIIYLLTFLIFITIFSLTFFELLYLYSKRSFLTAINKQEKIETTHSLKRLAQTLNWPEGILLPKIFNYSQIEKLLTKAGKPFDLTIVEFITLHRLLGDITFLMALFLLLVSGELVKGLILGIIFWLALTYLPITWLKIIGSRRVHRFNYNFSTFIDMLALTVDAGMNFENALFFTTNKFQGVLYEEFKYVETEMSYGHSLDKALRHLQQRIDSVDLKRFITAIKQAKQLGTPLADVLAIQSKLILTSRIQRAEELSRTASVKISIPLVFFIFPALLILYLVPAILQFMGV